MAGLLTFIATAFLLILLIAFLGSIPEWAGRATRSVIEPKPLRKSNLQLIAEAYQQRRAERRAH